MEGLTLCVELQYGKLVIPKVSVRDLWFMSASFGNDSTNLTKMI